MLPKLEFIDSLLTGTGKDLDLQTIKVIDQLSGHDGSACRYYPSSCPIDAHSLPSEGVNRLCYAGMSEVAQKVCRSKGAHKSGRRIVWRPLHHVDFEIMSLMISSLHSLGLDDITWNLATSVYIEH